MVFKICICIIYLMNNSKFIPSTFEVEKKKIGLRLKQIRKSIGYNSHENFAYDHGIDRAQYGKYEAGSSNITLSTLVKILNHMKINLTDFFNDQYDSIDL